MKKPSKYRNVRTVVDGITFASKREGVRYSELKLMERAGKICSLTLQPRFPVVVGPGNIKVCTYVADFRYFDGEPAICKAHIEDVKGVRTPLYKLKKKLVEALYDVVIEEV